MCMYIYIYIKCICTHTHTHLHCSRKSGKTPSVDPHGGFEHPGPRDAAPERWRRCPKLSESQGWSEELLNLALYFPTTGLELSNVGFSRIFGSVVEYEATPSRPT